MKKSSLANSIQGVRLTFYLFQKLISWWVFDPGQKFQQFWMFHEGTFHMRTKIFLKNFNKTALVPKIDQRWRHPSKYLTWSKLLTLCAFKPLKKLYYNHDYFCYRWFPAWHQHILWRQNIILLDSEFKAIKFFLDARCKM